MQLTDPAEARRLEARGSKYKARRTWSELCQRWFASKAEAVRGEELVMLAKVGMIEQLQYQVRFTLCTQPRVTITLDFAYCGDGGNPQVYEDVKGVLTRDFRTKLAWLKQKFDIDVVLVRHGTQNEP
ncbi:MAG TPA: hypothetical protein VJA25_01315 [Dehalococcoidia bacterium]|nr:hypothetical protein [Dehalococcoidia bacterium]